MGLLVGLLVAAVIFIPIIRKTAEVIEPYSARPLTSIKGALNRVKDTLYSFRFFRKMGDLATRFTQWLNELLIGLSNTIQSPKKKILHADWSKTKPLKSSLNVRDYLKTAEDAAKRSRTILIVLLVASVLTFMGFLNSMKANWMLHRIWALNDAGTFTEDSLNQSTLSQAEKDRILKGIKYRDARIGYPPNPICGKEEFNKKEDEVQNEKALYQKKFDHFYTSLMNSYIENSYTIRVPFFGVTFDINDLGVLGGAGLLIILFWYLIALMREIDNLRWSFKMAIARLGNCGEGIQNFYHLLAMGQVLTVPRMHGSKRLVVSHTPKVFVILPVAVHWMVTKYDCSSLEIGFQIDLAHTLLNVKIEVALLLAILLLTIVCLIKGREINTFWTLMWKQIYDDPGRSATNEKEGPHG